jgi:hypothetical protein
MRILIVEDEPEATMGTYWYRNTIRRSSNFPSSAEYSKDVYELTF